MAQVLRIPSVIAGADDGGDDRSPSPTQRVPRLAAPPTEPLRRGGAVETAALVEQAVSGVQLSAPPGYEVIEHNTPAGRRYFTYRTGNMTFRSRREAWRFFDGEVGREDVDPDANSDAD
eukprot:7385915-Prymnesium_polylepis.1